jgi:hypothetical protein
MFDGGKRGAIQMQEQQVEECEQACDGMSEGEIDEMLADVPVERSAVVDAED